MLRAFLFTITLCLLISLTVYAQSQRPTPEESEQAAEGTTNNQHGTPQSSLSVKPVPAPATQGESDRAAKAKDEKSIEKGLLWVAVLQLLTFVAQAIILGKSLAATKLAAEAAKKSAEATTQTVANIRTQERAYLFVEVEYVQTGFRMRPPDDEDSEEEYFSNFIVTNHGKTPAILKNIHGLTNVFGKELPEIPPDSFPHIPPGTVIITAGGQRTYPVRFRMNYAKWGAIDGISQRLICMGRIGYQDIFGAAHETGFCWEYQERVTDFYPCNDHERNYRT